MTLIPFDVNNNELRNKFLLEILPASINELDKNTMPAWGKMTPQHMIEHLILTFEISAGKLQVGCKTHERFLPRVKLFLYDNTETPKNFRNPLLEENPMPLKYTDYAEAKSILIKELYGFTEHFKLKPDFNYVHPIFGPLEKDEWERAHFKHCYHHLLQFGLIEPECIQDNP
ncbi:MAG: DUF1569 domain-containing protein [Bacteroidetes bacterium]|nr:DUF1569 domain-containing protein [Bacteroidota bacterium]